MYRSASMNYRAANPPTKEKKHGRQYWDEKLKREVTVVQPGQLYVCGGNNAIYTLLGSCIAVCLHDVRLGIGGMNHFLLPENIHGDDSDIVSESARYGKFSMELLLNAMYKSGSLKINLRAKVFGGAHVLNRCSIDVGERNIEFVKSYLIKENIQMVKEDTGEKFSRKIFFIPETGEVKLKRAEIRNQKEIATRDASYIKQLSKEKSCGSAEIFDVMKSKIVRIQ